MHTASMKRFKEYTCGTLSYLVLDSGKENTLRDAIGCTSVDYTYDT